jgi:mannose-1-phosphate guanylyltransferase
MATDRHLYVTVLAGGVGSRFWPVSTPERPKQLLPLAGENPMIRETVERARRLVPDSRLRILTGDHLVEPIRGVLPELSPDAFLIEPRARGTGPVLTWAAWALQQNDPDATLISLHSDHVIEPPDAFTSVLEGAVYVARQHRSLVTVAVPPDRPEVGYGYIQPGDSLTSPDGLRSFRVRGFHEKPDRETAGRYLDEGYLWNSGIFVWRADVFLEEVREHAPEIGRLLVHLDRGRVERFFDEAPTVSVDEAILERSRRVAGVEATFRWDDVGNWEAMSRTREGDEDGNVVLGDGRVVDGSGNVVFAEDGPVVLFGVDELVAVRTAGVTLVMPKDRAPNLKELLDRLPDELRSSGE